MLRLIRQYREHKRLSELHAEKTVRWLRKMRYMDESPDVKRIGEFARMDAKNRERRKG